MSAQATVLYNEFEHHTFEITATSPRGQRVNKIIYLIHVQFNLDHIDELVQNVIEIDSVMDVIVYPSQCEAEDKFHKKF